MSEIANAHAQGVLTQSKQAISEHAQKHAPHFSAGSVFDRINKLNEKKFRSIPYSERAVFIPHCLRSRDCKARNSEDGWLCIGCGRCKIKEFKNKAEELGYKVFIVPGFSMVKKLIGKYGPKAVVGVSCESEMSIAKENLGKDVISQGLLLLKDGCVETEVDWEKLKRICF